MRVGPQTDFIAPRFMKHHCSVFSLCPFPTTFFSTRLSTKSRRTLAPLLPGVIIEYKFSNFWLFFRLLTRGDPGDLDEHNERFHGGGCLWSNENQPSSRRASIPIPAPWAANFRRSKKAKMAPNDGAAIGGNYDNGSIGANSAIDSFGAFRLWNFGVLKPVLAVKVSYFFHLRAFIW